MYTCATQKQQPKYSWHKKWGGHGRPSRYGSDVLAIIAFPSYYFAPLWSMCYHQHSCANSSPHMHTSGFCLVETSMSEPHMDVQQWSSVLLHLLWNTITRAYIASCPCVCTRTVDVPCCYQLLQMPWRMYVCKRCASNVGKTHLSRWDGAIALGLTSMNWIEGEWRVKV